MEKVQTKNNLKISYTNTKSARNKMKELYLVVCAGSIDVIAKTETWFNLKSQNMIAEYTFKGLYVQENINCIKICRLVTESVWVKFLEIQEKITKYNILSPMLKKQHRETSLGRNC